MSQSVDDILQARTVAAMTKHDKAIRDRIVAGAKQLGYAIKPSDIERVEFVKFSGLQQTVHPTFGSFVTRTVSVPTHVEVSGIRNNSAAGARHTIHYGEKETQEFNWSITNGITLGASVTEKAGVPGLSSELTLNMQMSVSMTAGEAWRHEKDWSEQTEVTLSPYSAVHIQAILVRVFGDLPFSLEVQKSGTAECRVTLHYHGTRTRPFKIALSDLLTVQERTITVVGTIGGACGVSCNVDIQDAPLTVEEKQALPGGVSTTVDSLGTLGLNAAAEC